ncbi:MAG: hypothetical protein KKA73_30095 [Chloroflexi bacterium]|nr:hypothetical protein [Chloroflexota bacterium]MBU1751951.1 hypothetical protein [Chloroflexota bacterium]
MNQTRIMPDWPVLDTWPHWQAVWARVAQAPLDDQIDAWANEYMARYPALFAKQTADYASAGVDWRTVARDRVFPHLAERAPRMAAAHDVILAVHTPVLDQFGARLGVDFSGRLVIYVGLECGAGWATTYEGTPACLLGLEAIANLDRHTPERLRGLIAHELGHLAHMVWRERAGASDLEESEADPLFLLYSEGFAQRVEHVTLGCDAWHMGDEDQAWLAWCQAHVGALAAEFLRRLDAGEPVREFFGSWYDIQGHSQTGYYLGHEVVRDLERDGTPLPALAVWSEHEVQRQVRRRLRALADQ